MKFSVVIALYNKAPYVESAVRSVLDQRFTDFEIIVVDDGSTDGGADKLAALEDRRIRLVRQANAGVSLARNRGVSLARGEWVAFLDADDWLHPGYLDALVQAQSGHPDADFVASQFVELPDSVGASWPAAWSVPESAAPIERIDDLVSHWTRETTFCASSFAVRTALLEAMQPCFPPGESFGEDVDLWFRLSQHTALILVRSPLVAYRISVPGSLCDISPKLHYPPFLRRMKDRASGPTRQPKKVRALLRLVDHFELTLARDALIFGKRNQALQFLLRSSCAARSIRWWSTASMMLIPQKWVARWQAWRVKRRAPELRLE